MTDVAFIPSYTHDTVRGLYARACRWRGARDLFADPVLRLSGIESWTASVGLARAFAARGMARGSVVAFLCKPSAAHAASWFGTAIAGGIACSLHVRETPQRLGETLAWLGAALLVHDDDLAELARDALAAADGAGIARLGMGESLDAARSGGPAADAVLAGDVAPDDVAAGACAIASGRACGMRRASG